MNLGKVVGRVTGTVKDPQLSGVTLLVVEAIDELGAPLGERQVVADAVGAGVGDWVLVTTGSAARQPAAIRGISTDATAVMIIDHISMAEKEKAPKKSASKNKESNG